MVTVVIFLQRQKFQVAMLINVWIVADSNQIKEFIQTFWITSTQMGSKIFLYLWEQSAVDISSLPCVSPMVTIKQIRGRLIIL